MTRIVNTQFLRSVAFVFTAVCIFFCARPVFATSASIPLTYKQYSCGTYTDSLLQNVGTSGGCSLRTVAKPDWSGLPFGAVVNSFSFTWDVYAPSGSNFSVSLVTPSSPVSFTNNESLSGTTVGTSNVNTQLITGNTNIVGKDLSFEGSALSDWFGHRGYNMFLTVDYTVPPPTPTPEISYFDQNVKNAIGQSVASFSAESISSISTPLTLALAVTITVAIVFFLIRWFYAYTKFKNATSTMSKGVTIDDPTISKKYEEYLKEFDKKR